MDPCEHFADFVLPKEAHLCGVDTDRALYDGTPAEGNLLAFLFDQAEPGCDYGGGNIFEADPAVPSDTFDAICDAGDWQSADALSCFDPGTGTLACTFFLWENPAAGSGE